ncbi:TetR/AcrR family transcriptional regulator [Alkaliphilus pronyensis]|uniref:TetR/AcrR family transcriptional regulator n=2 Tax=Alkaliphilus pronyensis TaxID=1482732 RepID=A0A6I0F492_9FIRM|nr:TetR/AcrR family transcriptional regulator [Alkaliphilus pronyensis]
MPKNTFFNLPQEKRNRIINAAIEEFSKVHYKKVTIDSIVNSAGVPKGSFYQYFHNKDDLYKYLFSQIVDQKKQALVKVKKLQNQLSFRQYVMTLLEQGKKFEQRVSNLSALKDKFMNECSQEVKRDILKNEIPKSYEVLEEAVEFYIKKGELRQDLDVKTAAYVITSCFVNIQDFRLSEEQAVEDVLIDILDVLIVGMK